MKQRIVNWILVALAVPPAIAGSAVVFGLWERLPDDWRVFLGIWAVSLVTVLFVWWVSTMWRAGRQLKRDARARQDEEAKLRLLREMNLLKEYLDLPPPQRGDDRITALKAIMADSRMHALGLFTPQMRAYQDGEEIDPRPGLLESYIAVLEERSYSYLMRYHSRKRPMGVWRRVYERTMDFIEDSYLFYPGWWAMDGMQSFLDKLQKGSRTVASRLGRVYNSRSGGTSSSR